ncbi:MAG: cytochrome c3 family protein [Phycisphaerales bacterium]|nr:MAG: cytochrome c3 family protein [Phycisphaerales bacterium]
MLRAKFLITPSHAGMAIFLLISGAVQSILGQEVMPNSSKECAICHIRWVRAFERTETPEDRMEEVLERQAGSGDMCLSCHDGSVTDSRFKVWSTRHHTTDSVPSAAVRIPTETFPLDAQGRMTCATCHTAHAVPESSDLRTVIFLRQPNVDSSLCLACHLEHAAKNDFQHPLGNVDYPIPQEILEAGGKTSAQGHTIICQTCHEPHGARNPWMLVLPPSKLCIACHTDKSPETAPPAGAPIHHIGQAYPGFEPPATLLQEKATFGAGGELSCLSCHRLHDASGAKPLLIRNNQDSSLCLDCHPTEKTVLDSPHDLRFSSPQTVNASGQTASESGPCGACHRIHGWARDVPDTHRPHSSGCMECHQSGGPGSPNRLYVDAHTVGTPVPTDMPATLPLDKTTGSIGCLTCHEPHSPLAAEIEAEKTDGIAAPSELPDVHHPRITTPPGRIDSEVQEPRSFLRYRGSRLCRLCHDTLTDLPGQPHDPERFGPAARDKLLVHPSTGPCRVCHTTHNAQGPHLWARSPVATEGQITGLCGDCHGDKLGAANSVHDLGAAEWARELGFVSKGSCLDCHPVHDPNEQGGIWGRISSDGTAPWSCETCHRAGAPGKAMQTAHMGKPLGPDIESLPANMIVDSAGRIVCTTCHDIHQKPQGAKLLVAPIAALCGACHQDKLGIRNSVHDPGVADWAKELGFVSRGSCIDCHPPHGPPGESGIWTALGSEISQAQSCESCHRPAAPGQAMETPHMGKSLGAEIEELPENMPLSTERHILCVTCHDIHQAEQGPKLLASARTDSGVCLACHVEAAELIGTLHDLRTSAPDARNVRGETAAESGPCSSCHLAHFASDVGGVWAQGSRFEGSHGRGLCTCCHRQGECASNHIPKHLDHPDVALVNRTPPGQPGYMPTLDQAGEPSDTGAISCLTCHEPHIAPPSPEQDGRSAQHRPDRRSRFLRPETNQGLCADCHGVETLWRFLYYHKEQRNPYPDRNLTPGP